jgi:hypothetical protein
MPQDQAARRTHVDQPVGGFGDVEVVLDDEDGVAGIDEPVEGTVIEPYSSLSMYSRISSNML